VPTSHHPIPSSPYTVAPHHLATSHHPCYQLSLSCTTNHTVVVQHPYCSAPTPPYAVTLQPPAQLWTSSTPLHPTLPNPIPSVPHRVVAQHHHLPKSLSPCTLTASSSYSSSSFTSCTVNTPHSRHPIPPTPWNIASSAPLSPSIVTTVPPCHPVYLLSYIFTPSSSCATPYSTSPFRTSAIITRISPTSYCCRPPS